MNQKKLNAFTLIELMIVIAIIGILIAVAIPTYQNYTRRAQYTEVVQATAPYKMGVTECYQTTGALTDCDAGKSGVPAAISAGKHPGLINTLTIADGVITVTPKAEDGFTAKDTYILTPAVSNGYLSWTASGGGVINGYTQ